VEAADAETGEEPHFGQPDPVAGLEGSAANAPSPWRLSWSVWKAILWRTCEEIGNDRLLAVAAGVVFYGLLALFPAITALVSFYGLFTNAATINDHLSALANVLPAGGIDIVSNQINRVVAKGDAKLGFGFIFGLALAIWSANAGMKAIFDGLNVIYDNDEQRGFIRLNLVSLAFTFGALVSLLLAIGAVVVFPIALFQFGLQDVVGTAADILRWPFLLLLVLLGLAVLYRFGSTRKVGWKWVTPGSLFAGIAWLAGSALLSWYLSAFANYDATYGSLGAAIGLMMWMWLSAIVIFIGAELNAQIDAFMVSTPLCAAPSIAP
jgi:membrane protein